MRSTRSMTRLCLCLLVLLTGRSLHAADVDEPLQVSRNSAFIQRLLHRPVAPDHRKTRIATLVLSRTGNFQDGEALEQFDKRRLLAKYLGEPFEFSGTIAQAIEAERNAEPLESVIARARAAVTVDYASPDETAPPATPESMQFRMMIRHNLRVPIRAIGIQIGKIERGKPQPYYLSLTCTPAGPGSAFFAPDFPELALCSGHDHRQGWELAIQALLKREIPSPLPVYSFSTREGHLLYGDDLRIDDDDETLIAAAAHIVSSASCEDLGVCEQRAAERWQAARVPTLAVASIVVFLLAVFASSRVPARRSTGVLFGFLSTLVIAVSVIALAFMFPATAPDLGFDAYLYYGFYIYAVLPHLALVGIIAMSLIGGTPSRLRLFAVTLGGLTPVLVWLSVVSYSR